MKIFPFEHILDRYLERFLSPSVKTFSGLYGSSFSYLLMHLFRKSRRSVILISSEYEKLMTIGEDLAGIAENEFLFFPRLESSPFEIHITHPEKNSRYQRSLIELHKNPEKIILVPFSVALLKTIDSTHLQNEYFEIRKEEEIDRDSLIEFLTEFGYNRSDSVEEIGDFAIRGAIVDIFPFQEDHPIRVEFFGDEVISIREFDILSQLSIRELDYFRFSSPFNQNLLKRTSSLFSYFPENAILILDQPDLIHSEIHQWHEEIFKHEDADSSIYLTAEEFFTSVNQFEHKEYAYPRQENKGHISFPFAQPDKFHGSIKLFLNFLQKQKSSETLNSVFVFCENEKRKESLLQIIEEELGYDFVPNVIVHPLTAGFKCIETDQHYLTEHEIFNRIRQSKFRKKPVSSGSILRKMSKLNPGDIVVHVDYGIGIYEGEEKISIAGGPSKDVVKLSYRDGDILYVSLDKINKIQKYTASRDDFIPELTKLGSPEWIRIRKKTQKEIEKLAADLIQIYAMRMTRKGFAFSEDSMWQRELETLFPYEETPDQLKVIEEVKKDMQSDKPMDRLLCGDVGFGKTEVAIRAAFKAVQDGKQVAVLVPTTLLANQHYHTFTERMKNFPVNIEMLSRFRSRKQQQEILEKTAEGQIDILIGTHRILSDDVRFKDLGLLIIDEEQRFGVSHKEKIKKYKATIDVLTMTATPIPRTLHMALVGARDLSQIETPPRNRLPIYTEVCTWDDRLIRQAILKEIKRDGQVFFVHNRIETIYGVLERLKEIVPEARFVVAHGQMKEKDLEKIMDGFYHHQYDVLVATMIIENGIDIPSCNTIFINDAHRFGLSQLYQLRGRVGRSEQQAYAYLIVPSLHKLRKDSLKRLFALQEYTELGSGIKIAMKDLEIRGAGNILGARQSGHINAIGYDLYVKILNEAVEKIKHAQFQDISFDNHQPETVECTVDISAEIYFPDEYIGSQSEKAFLYYRLGQINSYDQLHRFVDELKDRFGQLPEPAENLIFLHYLRILGSRNYIQRIQLTEKKLIFTFHHKFLDNKTGFDSFVKRVTTMEGVQTQFKQEKSLKLVITSKMGNLLRDNFAKTKKLLQEFMDLHYIK